MCVRVCVCECWKVRRPHRVSGAPTRWGRAGIFRAEHSVAVTSAALRVAAGCRESSGGKLRHSRRAPLCGHSGRPRGCGAAVPTRRRRREFSIGSRMVPERGGRICRRTGRHCRDGALPPAVPPPPPAADGGRCDARGWHRGAATAGSPAQVQRSRSARLRCSCTRAGAAATANKRAPAEAVFLGAGGPGGGLGSHGLVGLRKQRPLPSVFSPRGPGHPRIRDTTGLLTQGWGQLCPPRTAVRVFGRWALGGAPWRCAFGHREVSSFRDAAEKLKWWFRAVCVFNPRPLQVAPALPRARNPCPVPHTVPQFPRSPAEGDVPTVPPSARGATTVPITSPTLEKGRALPSNEASTAGLE